VLVVQTVPSAMHLLLKQQRPPVQVLPSQHGWPESPHARQLPEDDVDEQIVFAEPQRSLPLEPAQHCSPALPQGVQKPLLQAKPAPHVLPQQG
jgi:hypothetical protein